MRFIPVFILASLSAIPLVSPQAPAPTKRATPIQTVAPSVDKPQRITRDIAEGVVVVQETWPDGDPAGPLVVTTTIVDPARKGVRVEAALGQDRVWGSDATFGRESVSALALRHKATVGINAGFFPYAGNPIGLHIQDGNLVTEPSYRRTCFLLTKKGEARFAAFDCRANVSEVRPEKKENKDEPGKSFPLAGMNRRPAAPNKAGKPADELLLFTPLFADNTLRVPGRTEVILEGIKGPIQPNKSYTGTVRTLNDGGGNPILKETVVLSGSGGAADFLKEFQKPGSQLRFRLDVTTTEGKSFEFSGIEYAVAGGPRLITAGAVSIPLEAEGIKADFSTTRHPRTAVGVTKEGKLLLVTVDGRQQGLSRGISLPDLAELMRRAGAVEAVNLDGGGSTACVVHGALINSPSEGSERPVASMLLVYAKERSKVTGVRVGGLLPSITMHVGQWRAFAQPNRDSAPLLWGVRPSSRLPGFIRQDGTFFAVRPGNAIVQALPLDNKGTEQQFIVEVVP